MRMQWKLGFKTELKRKRWETKCGNARKRVLRDGIPVFFLHPFSWDKNRKKRPYGSPNEPREFVFQNFQRNTTRFDAATTQCVTRNHRVPALNSIHNTCVLYVRESEMGALRPSLPFLILWTNIGRRILIEKIPNFLRVSPRSASYKNWDLKLGFVFYMNESLMWNVCSAHSEIWWILHDDRETLWYLSLLKGSAETLKYWYQKEELIYYTKQNIDVKLWAHRHKISFTEYCC